MNATCILTFRAAGDQVRVQVAEQQNDLEKSIAVVQTPADPPNHGRMARVIPGWSRRRSRCAPKDDARIQRTPQGPDALPPSVPSRQLRSPWRGLAARITKPELRIAIYSAAVYAHRLKPPLLRRFRRQFCELPLERIGRPLCADRGDPTRLINFHENSDFKCAAAEPASQTLRHLGLSGPTAPRCWCESRAYQAARPKHSHSCVLPNFCSYNAMVRSGAPVPV